jgi:EAL domain-containing protein (putative c-di-GMP-specific phosphodiesterase class I)/GGDEF domain-containing protein
MIFGIGKKTIDKKVEYPANNQIIFYTHNLKNGQINWYGDVTVFFGTTEEELNNRDKFYSIVHPDDIKDYRFHFANISDDIHFDFRIRKGKNYCKVKEVATITENQGEHQIHGMIATSNSDPNSEFMNKHGIGSQSILTGKFDTSFLATLKSTFKNAVDQHKTYVLLMVSIDNLPMILSWHSEAIASKIMGDLEIKIQKILPANSKIYRINVEQFGIILEGSVQNEVEAIVGAINKIVNLYKNPNIQDAIHLRLSIGSVYFPLGIKNEVDAINKSYLALSNVKGKAHDFYCDFEDAKREHLDSQNEMAQLNYLQEAFNESRIRIAYQPIVHTKTGETKNFECLMRILDREGNLDSAGRFIPIAEKMGAIETIDEYMLRAVVAELTKYKDITLAINISNLTTGNEQWLKMCGDVLTDESVANRLIIEITETAAQRDLRDAAYFTAALQAMGCKVSLDDFGVGFTSFRQLRSLSIDVVKIDGSFILGLEENSENMLFIRSLLDFNHAYGLETVAECVESGDVAKILMDIGVDYMQGYYFGRPSVKKPWAGE